jgi:hypothetical protein
LSVKFPPNLFCRGVQINVNILCWRVHQRGNIVSCHLRIGKRVKEKSRILTFVKSFELYGFISYHGISTVISDESALLIIQYYYQRSFQSSALCLLVLFIYFCWSAVCPLPVHHLITVKAVFNWTLTLLRRHVNIYKLTFYILMPLCKLILNFKQVFLWYCYSTNMLNQPTN